MGRSSRRRELQTFNVRNPHSGFFLATVQWVSRTSLDETATRLERYMARRLHQGVSVHPAWAHPYDLRD